MAGYNAALAARAYEMGLCDERQAVFAATAGRMPGGGSGRLLLAVKGRDMHIFRLNVQSGGIGDYICSVPFDGITRLKVKPGFLHELLTGYALRFEYGAIRWEFMNCHAQKYALSVIAAEAGLKPRIF